MDPVSSTILSQTVIHLLTQIFHLKNKQFYHFNTLKNVNDDSGCNVDPGKNTPLLSKRKQKIFEYANFQYYFKKNRRLASNTILDGPKEYGDVNVGDFETFWGKYQDCWG